MFITEEGVNEIIKETHLNQLTYLNLSGCNLLHIPSTVWQCTQITALNLSHNGLLTSTT
jgi:Leucine-rich repeat (LRR) protein